MSSSESHDAWARTSWTEGDQLARTQKNRWATVAYFYAALHMVRSAFAGMDELHPAQQQPSAHTGPDGMDALIRDNFPEIRVAYRALFDASIDVRYNGGEPTAGEVEHYRHNYLADIGSAVCKRTHPRSCACWMRAL